MIKILGNIPLNPFEPVSTKILPQGQQWIAQIKWDGTRVLTYFDGSTVSLFNRKQHERTLQYLELTNIKSYCKAASIILDGEVIALKDGKPSFHEVMKRDSIRNTDKLKKPFFNPPITYMIFDILYINGNYINKLPLSTRYEILKDNIMPTDTIQLVENFPQMADLYQVIKDNNLEGIVCKDLTSTYQFGGKDKRWQKKKVYNDLIAVVGGVALKNNLANSLLLGLYDYKGNLWYIGNAGAGKLTQLEWKNLTEVIKPLQITKSSFINYSSRKVKGVAWLQPVLTVKIQYLEFSRENSLRHPTIQSFVNVNPRECIFEEMTPNL